MVKTIFAIVSIAAIFISTAFALPPEFDEHTVNGTFDGATDVYAVDLDGDGDVDILGAAAQADDICWWRNDGAENFTKFTIDANFDYARSVYAADVDSDGDVDVLGAAVSANDIAWWKNDGAENFTKYIIAGDFEAAYDVYAADVDGDGDMDVLGAAYNALDITWWKNDGSENFTEYTIAGNLNSGATSVYAADVDSDGDMDVVGAGWGAGIYWWENDGDENFGAGHLIQGSFSGAVSVYAADVDSDGDVDVLGAAYYADDITWWENNGSQNFTEHTIKGDFDGANSVYAADLDSDGDIDVLGAARLANDITWWENNGSQSFTEHIVNGDFSNAYSVHAADVDSDGRLDILGTANIADDIAWWENQIQPDFVPTFTDHTIDAGFSQANYTYPSDLDGDGDIDILASSKGYEQIDCYYNNGSGSFTWQNIGTSFVDPNSVLSADLDGDGDLDVLGAASGDGAISWWPNQGGGTPITWGSEILVGYTTGAFGVHAADVDGDGDMDVLSTGSTSNDVAWWSNNNGLGTSWTQNTFEGDFTAARGVQAVDLDGDGDMDIAATAETDHSVFWYQNNGSQTFTKYTITSSLTNAFALYTIDMDSDGDIDVLASSIYNDDIVWYENDGTPTAGWTTHTIDGSIDCYHLHAADLDRDGDIDVVGTGYDGDELNWYENNNGLGTSWTQRSVDAALNGAHCGIAADISGDGDLDIVAAAYDDSDLVWYKNAQNPNPDPAASWTEHVEATNITSANSVVPTDLDNDGDVDIVCASWDLNMIHFLENDGSENFTRWDIDPNFVNARNCFVADIDGDSDLDIVGAAYTEDDISWWENDGTPANHNWTETLIEGDLDNAVGLFATDVDGDGDIDVIGGGADPSVDLAWYSNNNGDGSSWTENTIDADLQEAFSVTAADYDGDGDIDVASFSYTNGGLYWYENDGSENFTKRAINATYAGAYWVHSADVDMNGFIDILIVSQSVNVTTWFGNDGTPATGDWTRTDISTTYADPRCISAADMDLDGDTDVLVISTGANVVTWWENQNILGTSWGQHNINTSFTGAADIHPADVDGDGDVDIVGASWNGNKISWFENDINPYVDPQRIQHSISKDRWSIVGIPVNVPDGQASTLFQGDFDGNAPNGENWQISRWYVGASGQGYQRFDYENYGYSGTIPDGDPADFTPGNGYWVIQSTVDNCVMDIESSQHTGPVDQSSRFQVALNKPVGSYRGLTMVANPFDYNYDWRQTWIHNATDDQYKTIFEAAAANWISGYAYCYDGWDSEYYNVNFRGDSTANYTLYPWDGCWIEQLSAGASGKDLYVEFVPQCMMDSEPPEVPDEYRGTESENDWSFALSVSTSEEDFHDNNNIIGIDEIADDGYDMLDAMEYTPMASNWVQLYFPHSEWGMGATKFTYDFRSTDFSEGEKYFDFTVRCYNIANREFVLTWPDMENVSKHYEFYLGYPNNDVPLANMREANQYSFNFSEQSTTYPTMDFRITVKEAGSATLLDNNIRFGLKEIFPNPSNDQIRVTFALPETQDITLAVFNILGQEVAVLQDGLMSAGEHSLVWKAEGLQASGIYFIQLKADSKTSVRKIMMLR